jgi:hypothetical protein
LEEAAPDHDVTVKLDSEADDAEGEAEEDEPEDVDEYLSTRDRDAERARRTAVFGLLFWPLQLYALYLVFNVLLSDAPLDARYRRLAWQAAMICVPFILKFGIAMRALF